MTTLEQSRMQNGHTGETQHDSDFERLLNKPFVAKPPHEELAGQLGIPANQICSLLRQSVMPRDTSDADFLAFLQVCARYRLNPILREIYPMPKKGGGIVPIVGVDGWCSIVLREKRFDGCSFRYVADDEGNLEMVFCTMYVKGQTHPVEVGERMVECVRNSEPWKLMPYRMLRHRAYIQAARIAFGIHGIFDEDEGMHIAGYANVEEGFNALMAGKVKKANNPFRNPGGAPASSASQGVPAPAGEPTLKPEGAAKAPDAAQDAPAPSDNAPAPEAANGPAASGASASDPRTPEEIAEELASNASEKDMRVELQRAAASSDANIKRRYENAKDVAQVREIPNDMKLPDLQAVFYNFTLAGLKNPKRPRAK